MSVENKCMWCEEKEEHPNHRDGSCKYITMGAFAKMLCEPILIQGKINREKLKAFREAFIVEPLE